MKKIILGLIMSLLISSCTKEDLPENLTTYPYTYSDIELDMLNKINHYRDSVGVSELTIIEHISYKCYEHNQYMIDNNVFNHDYFYDRVINLQKIYNAIYIGEIVAYNYITNDSALEAWKNSSAHDTLIKSVYSRVGISISINPNNNRKYYTVIFIN
jgi:uncharacterized protein YkwD